jgi:hypothetical protein
MIVANMIAPRCLIEIPYLASSFQAGFASPEDGFVSSLKWFRWTGARWRRSAGR